MTHSRTRLLLWSFRLLTITAPTAQGHGYVRSPRSRNWYARVFGTDRPAVGGKPSREYCPHCLNRNTGLCGASYTNNYDDYVDTVGQPLPWESQATYESGDTIRIVTKITTHHGGHVEVRACPDGRLSTWDCLEEYVLEFVDDRSYHMPVDGNYPERGYLAGWKDDDAPHEDFVFRFRLPDHLRGEQVLLQWRYITANSCKPPGYDDYFQGNNAEDKVLPGAWYSSNVRDCNLPYSRTGDTTTPGSPEQFFNCIEVTVLPPSTANSSLPLPGNDTAMPPPTPLSTAPVHAPITVVEPTVVVNQGALLPDQNSSSLPASSYNNNSKSRMIAYLGNWQSCPTAIQLDQYTHVMIAFAVSYQWVPGGKNTCSPTCEIATPPICANAPNTGLITDLHAAGKTVILSFGGAGMGGSWAGSRNDCWEYCYGREEQVVDRLVDIVAELNLDGVDIDYEYHYSNKPGFSKGPDAIAFLTNVTLGLREKLPPKALLAHVPMDTDIQADTDYYQMLVDVRDALDFVMPQFYNGVTRPALDGFAGAHQGSVSASSIYDDLVQSLFDGDATKVVFGFCIQDCGGTNSNAGPLQASTVMESIQATYGCHGGAFFWVAEQDRDGLWSSTVNQAMGNHVPMDTHNCSSVPSPVLAPVGVSPTSWTPLAIPPFSIVLPGLPPFLQPILSQGQEGEESPVQVPVSPSAAPVSSSGAPVAALPRCCPNGFAGNRAYDDCRSFYACVHGTPVGEPIPCPAGTLFDGTACNWAHSLQSCHVDPCN